MVTVILHVVHTSTLNKDLRDIIGGAEEGVKLATEKGVQWIHGDVFSGQNYVGDANYPDVTSVTKKIKAHAGKELVGIWTGATKASFRSASHKLQGRIIGSVYTYFGSKWHIGALFMDHQAKKTREIIEDAIKKNTK